MKNKDADVIIIGSGIIGLASAYYLLKEGKSVIVLEKGKPSDASSYANCGLVAPSHAMPLNSPHLILQAFKWMFKKEAPFYIKPKQSFTFWLWMLAFVLNARRKITERNKIGKNNLLMSSRALFNKLIEDNNVECNWLSEGVLFVFLSKTAFDNHGVLNKKLTQFNSALQATPYVGEKLRKKEPAIHKNVYGGWLYPIDAAIKPDELMLELTKIIKAKGAKTVNEAEVTGFKIENKSIAGLTTTAGYYTATNYVMATGAWSSQLAKQLQVDIPIIPGKGYSITMKSPSLTPQIPCLLVEKKVAVTPFKNSCRLGGTMEFSGFDDKIDKTRINAIKNAAKLYLKECCSEKITEEWFGYRPMTNNDLPIIDFVPGHKNLLVAAGHNMVGISMATGTGKLVSELLTGKKPHIDPSFYQLKSNLN